MVDYLEAFKSSIVNLSGYYAEVNNYLTDLSGQMEELKSFTSGQWMYSLVSGGLP